MPRKGWTKSWEEWRQFNIATWRWLIRRADFREDLDALGEMHYQAAEAEDRSSARRAKVRTAKRLIRNPFRKVSKRIWEVKSKWGLERFPRALEESFPRALEKCYEEDLLSVEKLEALYKARYIGEGTTDFSEEFRMLGFDAILLPPVSDMSSGPMPAQRDIKLYRPVWINHTMNFDQIMGAFERQLRYWFEFWGTRRTERGRPSKLNFQLQVFDAVHKGKPDGTLKPFLAVAKLLHKPVSTIREAYYAACRKIGVEVNPLHRRSKMANVDSDPKRAIVDPGPIAKCSDPKCRSAELPEEFCQKHKTWLSQDYVSQKALLFDPQVLETQVRTTF